MQLETVYSRFYSELARWASSRTQSPSEAEDIAQEAFLRALQQENFDSFGEDRQRAWLYTAARRLIIDRFRRRRREPAMQREEAWEDDLSVVMVAQLLHRLPPEQCELVSLRYFAGMNSKQIGDALDLPPPTVRTRLRAACKRLRMLYEGSETIRHDERGSTT